MITEQYKDKVYFSKLLCTDCPNIYKIFVKFLMLIMWHTKPFL